MELTISILLRYSKYRNHKAIRRPPDRKNIWLCINAIIYVKDEDKMQDSILMGSHNYNADTAWSIR